MSIRRLVLTLAVCLCASAGTLALGAAPALAGARYVPGVSFGEACSGSPCGDGQFDEPTSIAANDSESLSEPAAGDVYVLDSGDDRVERFSASGTYISQWNGGETSAGSFSAPVGIAVDSSASMSDPAAGDVYVLDQGDKVIDRFSSTGTYLSQLTGTCPAAGTCSAGEVIAFGQLIAVAVDPSGDLWTYEAGGTVDEFTDTGSFSGSFNTGRGTTPALAVDADENVYVIFGGETIGRYDGLAGHEEAEFDSNAGALAVGLSSGSLFVVKRQELEIYESAAKSGAVAQQTLPTGQESVGVAVGADGSVYVTQFKVDDVEIFDRLLLPTPRTGSASQVSETSETLQGTVNPEGEELSECYFEYGPEASYGQSTPCEQSPAQIGDGSEPVPVSAEVSGLQRDAEYHYRLAAANVNGTEDGADETLYTYGPPTVEEVSIASVGASSANVAGEIDAARSPTSYYVEYGTSEALGSSTSEASLGAPGDAVHVLVALSGLQPATEYHYRLLASNADGTARSVEATFTTSPAVEASSSVLPDERAYELVSPKVSGEAEGEVYIPAPYSTYKEYSTPLPERAAADGESVAYVAEPPASGGNGVIGGGQGNEWLATRTPQGWKASDIQPAERASIYLAFSSELSTGILAAGTEGVERLSPDAPEGDCDQLYARSAADGVFRPTITAPLLSGGCGETEFGGESADGSHLVFEDSAQLTAGAPNLSEEQLEGGEYDLYDLAEGRLSLVNVLPSGQPAAGAVLGRPVGPASEYRKYRNYDQPDLAGVVSAGGSRVFWTDLNNEVTPENPDGTTRLFVRENDTQPQSPIGEHGQCTVAADACTVQVDAAVGGGGEYWSADASGSQVLFTKDGDLYSYDLETGQTSDLAPHGEVLGVTASSEDGDYVYFVAKATLASNENSEQETPASGAGARNLYLIHEEGGEWSQPEFVAQLSPFDNALLGQDRDNTGDWRPAIRQQAAEATPDGHELVFMSRRSLTGPPNGASCGQNAYFPPNEQAQLEEELGTAAPNEAGYESPCSQIYRYEAESGKITCISCNPSREPLSEDQPPTVLPINTSDYYRTRVISEDGARVFFDTPAPLVSDDTNGLTDVYEWEQDGSGSCGKSGGCVYLLSGAGADEAWFTDASANGNDVFFASRSQLVPQDHDDKVDVYDARVDGGFPEYSQSCTGTGCQGVPPAPPTFATPASLTFAGVGDFAAKQVKPKGTAKCKSGLVKKHKRCVKSKRRKAGKKHKKAGKRGHRKHGKRSAKRSGRGRK